MLTREARLYGGRRRTVWVVTCDVCGREEVRNWGNLTESSIAAKNFSNQGWEAGHGNTCPDCRRPTKERTMPTIHPIDAIELTADQRGKVRGLLDANFDDGLGAYLDDYSDQRIGQEVGVPWSLVTKMREVAYGPIRVDPVLQKLEVEIARLEEDQALLVEQARALEQRVRDIKARMDEFQRRRTA